jgi:serine/threonine protein kinase
VDIHRDPWNLEATVEIRFTSGSKLRSSADAELPLPVVRAPDLSGRVLGQRYSLRRRIGGGSLGTVYEARDMTLGTAVAVKVLHPDYCGDEDFRRRFHQEARLGARLRHEHSVAVTDLGQSDDGLLYSVMEYLEGESLDALLAARPGPLPWRRVVTIAVQVCAALQAAHDRGVIHRDIKPGNCFLVRREGSDHAAEQDLDHGPPFTFVKVLDLGLARLMPSSGRPTPPGRLGAPEYLAPEQIQGFTCDHRVDVYALGVLMYKLLTRRLPFTGDNPAAIMRMHIETPPAPLRRSAGSEIPASLEAVVLRALAKDRAHRYPSAHAMAQAIRSAAADAEAETIAIHEADPDPSGLWRQAKLPPRTPAPRPRPAHPRGPDHRSGLLLLLLALSGIVLAVVVPGGPHPTWHVPDDGPVLAPPLALAPTPLPIRHVTPTRRPRPPEPPRCWRSRSPDHPRPRPQPPSPPHPPPPANRDPLPVRASSPNRRPPAPPAPHPRPPSTASSTRSSPACIGVCAARLPRPSAWSSR